MAFWNWLINALKWSRWLFVLLVVLFVIIPPVLYFVFRQYIYTKVDVVPEDQGYGLVLGAGIKDKDTPSNALQDRLDAAISLYKSKKITKILVSGARDSQYYDEPKTMKTALVKAGIPDEAITEDSEGFRTVDSCRRAKEIYGLSKVIVISQGFHLPRALFLCRSFGLDASGVYATGNFSTYYSRWYTIREVFAMYLAVWDVIIR